LIVNYHRKTFIVQASTGVEGILILKLVLSHLLVSFKKEPKGKLITTHKNDGTIAGVS
jgi:hypothetical protein